MPWMWLIFSQLLAQPAPAAPPMAERYTCLHEAYPEAFSRGRPALSEEGRSPHWRVQLKAGQVLTWDDGDPKDFDAWLGRPDLQDSLSQLYPAGPGHPPPEAGQDPGRARVQDLFKALYGKDKAEVRASLVTVPWLPEHGGRAVRFNARQGAAEALARVSAELDKLPADLRRYVLVHAGTFNWRHIKGTDRLSAHAWGVAIDIDVRNTNYWRWSRKKDGKFSYKNRIPMAIVEIFERHGFIWGGRWHHFDTMHFEYRPELLHPVCRQVKSPGWPAHSPPSEGSNGVSRPR